MLYTKSSCQLIFFPPAMFVYVSDIAYSFVCVYIFITQIPLCISWPANLSEERSWGVRGWITTNTEQDLSSGLIICCQCEELLFTIKGLKYGSYLTPLGKCNVHYSIVLHNVTTHRWPPSSQFTWFHLFLSFFLIIIIIYIFLLVLSILILSLLWHNDITISNLRS